MIYLKANTCQIKLSTIVQVIASHGNGVQHYISKIKRTARTENKRNALNAIRSTRTSCITII